MAPPTGSAALPHGPESRDWPGTRETDQDEGFDLRKAILKLFPLTHNDPTGRKALRDVQEHVGYFEDDAEVILRIRSKSRGNIDIRLDYEMKSMVIELLNQHSDVTHTQSGSNYRARIKKNDPSTVSKFGDKDSTGVSTTNKSEEDKK